MQEDAPKKTIGRPFQKGWKGGPGRPKSKVVEVAVTWENAAELAEQTLLNLLKDPSPKVRLEAAKYIRDCLKGKPAQAPAVESKPDENAAGPVALLDSQSLEEASA